MKRTPTPNEVIPKLEAFKAWLTERGAELLSPTNEYELVRFRTGKGVSIMYRTKNLDAFCSCMGDSQQAWREYCNPDSKWRAIPATRRVRPVSAEYKTIRERDGILCFFCAQVVPPYEGTIEHLIPVTHGGPNHISNKFLAHEDCNRQAGCLSGPEKIRIYHEARLKIAIRNIDDRRRQDRLASAGNPA